MKDRYVIVRIIESNDYWFYSRNEGSVKHSWKYRHFFDNINNITVFNSKEDCNNYIKANLDTKDHYCFPESLFTNNSRYKKKDLLNYLLKQKLNRLLK